MGRSQEKILVSEIIAQLQEIAYPRIVNLMEVLKRKHLRVLKKGVLQKSQIKKPKKDQLFLKRELLQKSQIKKPKKVQPEKESNFFIP